jgi:isopentenyl-diphosphate delta-isomerase
MEDLILVDRQNTILGTAPKDVCHDGAGLLHRAFSIFVFNNNMELLLQKRASEKRLWPDYWSNSCCSHPSLNESMISASTRRLDEELGITGYRISELYRFEYQAAYLDLGSENELCSVIICRSDDNVTLNQAEVSAIRWINLPDLEVEIESQPDQFTPWLKLEFIQLTSTYLQQIHGLYS